MNGSQPQGRQRGWQKIRPSLARLWLGAGRWRSPQGLLRRLARRLPWQQPRETVEGQNAWRLYNEVIWWGLMTGVAGMLLTGVLRMDEAYASINWKTVFMMAGLIPLGWAMDSSGAAAWVAGHTIDKLPTGIPVWVLEVALALLTTAFSLVISHVGATIVMVPIAVNLALAAGGNPTAFALIVALSASNNLMTASNPVISMITGPANYTPREMWRVGGPLSLIYTCVVVLMINLMF